MSWIETVPFARAAGRLRDLYRRLAGSDEVIDDVFLAMSLRPHTLEGHLGLYRSVLHHSSNLVPRWFMEAIGVQISLDNGCTYCLAHHEAGLARLLDSPERARAMRTAFDSPDPAAGDALFDERERAALDYARRLTLRPGEVREAHIAGLRSAGWNDGEILELNQVTAYFNYGNRTSLGLGACLDGDALGSDPAPA